jgi:hypothetical protein
VRIQNLSGKNQRRRTKNDEEDSTRKTKHWQQQLERMENSLLEQQNEEPTGESRRETKILAAPNWSRSQEQKSQKKILHKGNTTLDPPQN